MIKHKLDAECENIYIGSTCDFRSRIRQHKSSCYNETKKTYNLKVYHYIRENGDWENFEFIILEECEVQKLKKLEQSYFDGYKPKLNMFNANGVDKEKRKEYNKEYYQNNTEKINEKNKEYRENNKEKINEKNKEYRENNKEKEKERKKIYDENNKEKIKERKKIYYEKNKQKFNDKFNCECGGKFTMQNKLRHIKTKKHQNYLSSI